MISTLRACLIACMVYIARHLRRKAQGDAGVLQIREVVGPRNEMRTGRLCRIADHLRERLMKRGQELAKIDQCRNSSADVLSLGFGKASFAQSDGGSPETSQAE
jgi:hypothetical protein